MHEEIGSNFDGAGDWKIVLRTSRMLVGLCCNVGLCGIAVEFDKSGWKLSSLQGVGKESRT